MAHAVKTSRSDGRLWIVLSWMSLCLILAMMGILALLICANSLRALWPGPIERVRLADGKVVLGFPVDSDTSPDGLMRLQYRVGNRDINSGVDFIWIYAKDIVSRDVPSDALLARRAENGDFIGFIGAQTGAGAPEAPEELRARLRRHRERWSRDAEPLRKKLASLGDDWQRSHFAALKTQYEMERAGDVVASAEWESRLRLERDGEQATKRNSENLMAELAAIKADLSREKVAFVEAGGRRVVLPLDAVVDVTWPNAMTGAQRLWTFAGNVWSLLTQYPREANTEGGIYPALFGTVMLVFLMAIFAFPLGVAAGVYLREYARDGFLSRTARVAVNNLAGVPSIVYGMFGLGFFIYGMGGAIDDLLYPERVAAGINTYGGGGILWSALTLGLLTLPVVIVATEEALATVPSDVRQGSLALGATRFQTLWHVILPMASPGIITGFILAMARAAGEVAPLMLTGAVKSAHTLPLDGNWPFVHLERKFMHLGFHIYDMGFQSPNVEASKPLVYLTALVLLVLVFVLNFAAISLRKRMREKYAMKGF